MLNNLFGWNDLLIHLMRITVGEVQESLLIKHCSNVWNSNSFHIYTHSSVCRYTIFFTWASPKQMVHTNYSRREYTKFALVYIHMTLSFSLSHSLSYSCTSYVLLSCLQKKNMSSPLSIERIASHRQTNQMEYRKLVIMFFFSLRLQIISFEYRVYFSVLDTV